MQRSEARYLGPLLREKRKARGLTLRAVSDRITALGGKIQHTTLSRIEQGKLDPGIHELKLLAELYDLPLQDVVDYVELEIQRSELPTGDIQSLYDAGLDHWKKGNIQEAMTYSMAVRQKLPKTEENRRLRQQACIDFATFARGIGRFRFAKRILDDVLCEPVDPSLEVRALVLSTSIWRGLGSPLMAMACIKQCEELVKNGDPREIAWVLQQKAKLLHEAGDNLEADKCLSRALKGYNETKDAYNAVRARILRIAVLTRLERFRAAKFEARSALKVCTDNENKLLEMFVRRALGLAHLAEGHVELAISELRRCLSCAVLLEDPGTEFFAHHALWKAYKKSGNVPAAARELGIAKQLVKEVDHVSEEVKEVRAAMGG